LLTKSNSQKNLAVDHLHHIISFIFDHCVYILNVDRDILDYRISFHTLYEDIPIQLLSFAFLNASLVSHLFLDQNQMLILVFDLGLAQKQLRDACTISLLPAFVHGYSWL
jgi:hypothetical protein